jgi:hypothetical protein
MPGTRLTASFPRSAWECRLRRSASPLLFAPRSRARSKSGYVDDPTHWRYSSARNYAWMESLLPVTIDW